MTTCDTVMVLEFGTTAAATSSCMFEQILQYDQMWYQTVYPVNK